MASASESNTGVAEGNNSYQNLSTANSSYKQTYALINYFVIIIICKNVLFS